MTLVVNMVGGPGTGKSTTAALTFGELKLAGVNCELVTEYAKDLVWEGRSLGNQVGILGKQYHRLWRLKDKVDVIVTDCPLFLSVYYGDHMSDNFKGLALELFSEFDNVTFFLRRVKAYNPAGRVQDETKARQIDRALWNLLLEHGVNFDMLDADGAAAKTISQDVIAMLNTTKET